MFVLSALILSLTVFHVSPQDLLQSQFPLYGLSEVAARKSSKLKTACDSQLKNLYHAIKKRETWALRMLDSSGSPVNGFTWGNNYWLGTYSQCRWVSSRKPTMTPEPSGFPPFGVDFYMGLFKQNTTVQVNHDISPKSVIHLGLCLPSACLPEDLGPLLTIWAKDKPLSVQHLYNFSMDFQRVRLVGPNFSWAYYPLTIIVMLVIAIAVLLTVSGTIYDIYVWCPSGRRKEMEEIPKNNMTLNFIKAINIPENSNFLSDDINLNECYEMKVNSSQQKFISVYAAKVNESPKVDEPKEKNFFKFLLCFSAIPNTKIILGAPLTKDELSVIHGLRFLGMVWLIWLYSVFYLKYYADNRPQAQSLSEGFSERIISNSTFSVDTFFFTGGFMLAFKYYKHRRTSFKIDGKFSIKRKVNEFSLLVLKRFIRLTPIYVVVLAVVVITVKTVRQTSLFEIEEPADEICRKYWWRNLAYINNLYKGGEMCMSWSWYLSTDMQFFLLGVFILILSTRFWRFASIAGVTLIVMSSLITGYLSYGNRYIQTNLQPQLALLHVLHYSPWTRVGPYLIGMFTGYFVIHLEEEFVIKRTIIISCWLVGFLCNVWALFGLYKKNMSPVSVALHTALSRSAWGFSLSWIVIACSTGNAGGIKAVLSYPGWIPFSKLSYSAYLLSPLIINLIIANSETAMHLDFFQMVVYFFGHLAIIYFCSFFFSLVIELPLATLGKRMIGKKHTQNQLSRTT